MSAVPIDEARRAERSTAERRRAQGRGGPWSVPNPDYAAPKLKLVDPLSLQGKAIPDRKWVVPGWIPHGHVTLLQGNGGDGKTTLAQQLATACATGGYWLGQRAERCRALMILCEDDADEIWRRQEDVNQSLGIEFSDLEDLNWTSRLGQENFLMVEGERGILQATDFFQSVHDAASDFGAGLLILDSLHDVFGGNENNRVQARQFMGNLTQLARDIDGAVMVCAHPSAAGLANGTGTSGSTAWRNSARSTLYLTRPEGEELDRDERILARTKSNYAGVGDKMALRWTAGIFLNEEAKAGTMPTFGRRSAQAVFLDLLDAVERENRAVSDSPNAGNFAPKLFGRRPDRRGYDKGDFFKAMESLFASGSIEVVDYGRPGDRHRKIARTHQAEASR